MGKSNQYSIILMFIFSLCFGKIITENSSSLCGDWEPYKEEKCFKIFESVGNQPFDAAQKICHQQENDSSLVSIRSLEEQKFFSDWLFKKANVVDTVWIGANYTSNKFRWSDGSEIGFTNWVAGSPKNRSDYCVQMQSDDASLGKWFDQPCKKKNLVVCQKLQIWSNSYLRKRLSEVETKLIDIRSRFNYYIKNFRAFSPIFNDSNNIQKIFAMPRNESTELTKQEAENLCTTEGSLPSIESEEIQSVLYKFLKKYSVNSGGMFWTTGREFNGKLEWTNNKNSVNFTNWDPNHYAKNGNNTCVFIWVDNGKWTNWKSCEGPWDTVCELPLI